MTPPVGRLPRAELRTLRLCTAILGASALAAMVTTSFVVVEPHRGDAPVSPWVLLMLVVVVPATAATLTPRSDTALLRRVNAVVVVWYAALWSLLAVAAATGRIGAGEVPWALTVTGPPMAAVLIAWGRRAAWLALPVATVVVQVIRALAGDDPQRAMASDVQAFFVSVTALLLFGSLIEASREFDRSAAAAVAGASRRSAEEARAGVRRRLQAVVHDELLAVLVLAAQDAPGLRAAVAARAARARGLLRDLHQPDAAERVPVDSALDRLRDVAAHEAPDAAYRLLDTRSGATTMPFDVAEALAGALRQALVNSRLHAGAGARRSVTVTADDDGLRVEATDDGAGFDPARVPPTRLGISTSIVGRLRSVAGGDAAVDSRPGCGTRVVLTWRPDAEPATEDAVPAPAAGILPDGDRVLRRTALAVVGVFLAAQAVLATLAAQAAGSPWLNALAFAGVAAALLGLGWSSLAPPGGIRTALVAGTAILTTALNLVPVDRDPVRYGDTWYVAAAGFVLLALAVRGRPVAAAAAGLVAMPVALTGVLVQRNDAADLLASSNRHTVLLLLGVAFVVGIGRIRARAARLQADELAAVRRQAFREAAARELRDRARSLEEVIGLMLQRLESAVPLTEAERRECAALDGRLRDEYRGGRIIRPPMIEAAMAARRRGVDVVLLDDAPDRTLPEPDLDAIARWLADRLHRVPEGRFTGRILPAGREALASAVAGDEVAELRAERESRRSPAGA